MISIVKTCNLLLLSLVLCIPHAHAEWDLRGGSITTDFSGKGKSRKNTFSKASTDNVALFAVEMGERSDDPCFLKMRYRDLVNARESTQTFDECSGKAKSLRTVSLPEGTFVTGVRVCLNAAEDKVKGIELIGHYGACLTGDDTVDLKPSPCSYGSSGGIEFKLCDNNPSSYRTVSCSSREAEVRNFQERTNCPGTRKDAPDEPDWEAEVHCPSHKVATGLKLNTREGGGDRRMFNGIALVCTTIVDSN